MPLSVSVYEARIDKMRIASVATPEGFFFFFCLSDNDCNRGD